MDEARSGDCRAFRQASPPYQHALENTQQDEAGLVDWTTHTHVGPTGPAGLVGQAHRPPARMLATQRRPCSSSARLRLSMARSMGQMTSPTLLGGRGHRPNFPCVSWNAIALRTFEQSLRLLNHRCVHLCGGRIHNWSKKYTFDCAPVTVVCTLRSNPVAELSGTWRTPWPRPLRSFATVRVGLRRHGPFRLHCATCGPGPGSPALNVLTIAVTLLRIQSSQPSGLVPPRVWNGGLVVSPVFFFPVDLRRPLLLVMKSAHLSCCACGSRVVPTPFYTCWRPLAIVLCGELTA